MRTALLFFSVFSLLFVSCKRDREYGYVRLVFEHRWIDEFRMIDEPLEVNGTTQYINDAGNILTFERLEYFISNLTISGTSTVRVEHPKIHYITNDTNYLVMLLTYQIPTGDYNNIQFTFGLDEENNKPKLFANPPQSNMFWPDNMGGGYHYMKIDGKWRNEGSVTNSPFNLHLGALEEIVRIDTTYGFGQISQQRDSIVKIDTFIHKFHNHFPVYIPRNFTVKSHKVTTVEPIIMNVKQWMEIPYTWDFNRMGSAIMSRRWALDSLAQNGQYGVFR